MSSLICNLAQELFTIVVMYKKFVHLSVCTTQDLKQRIISMRYLLGALLLILCSVSTALASTQPSIIFSQEVIAINPDGTRIPPVKISPQEMADIRTHDFDLGRQRMLRIHTNIDKAGERGLDDVVTAIERCYRYIESETGQKLQKGVMLYLIELDKVPYAYSFQASYNDASQWGEVRLALIERDAPLSGLDAPASLSDLLYDTLPHELGHDVLDNIPQLMHDKDGDVSQHTRWFIEGACEVLAKGFSADEAPSLHHGYLSLRNVDTVLAETQMRTDLLGWAQVNNNGMVLESDLYGAAMLSMMIWTESITLRELMNKLANHDQSLQGSDLIALMQETTGMESNEIFDRAHAHGKQLKERLMLASLRLD